MSSFPTISSPASIPDRSQRLQQSPAPGVAAMVGGSIFGATHRSQARSKVTVPTLDTRQEVNSYSRLDLLKSSRALFRNVAAWKRIVNGAPTLAFGNGLKPYPLTADVEWNKRALDYFNNRAGSREVWDVGGKWNYWESQRGLLSGRLKDGDIFPVLTESAAGRARFAFYEGHQCGDRNPYEVRLGKRDERFSDGVMTDRNNRALAYQFLDDRGATVIPRESVIAFMDYETRGQNRGAAACYHWINDGIDIEDIKAMFKESVKASASTGYYKYSTNDADGATLGLGAPVRQETLSDGSVVEIADVYGGGTVADLGTSRLDVLRDDRPHPNVVEFLNARLRDLALGVGLPAEVIFYLAGLRGAEVRLALVGADCWAREQQQKMIDTYCTRAWVYTVAKGMKAGDLPRCTDEQWWKVGHIAPQKITVDIGRDGSLKLKEYEKRLMTLSQWSGERGRHWEEEQDQRLLEDARGARRQREIAEQEQVSVDELIAYQKNEAPPAAIEI